MICLTALLAPQAPVGKIDLTAQTLAQSTAAIRALPPGGGNYLHVNVFDGNTVWGTADGAKRVAGEVKVLVTTAHERGYRVLGEWNCFVWKGIAKNPEAKGILEHRAINAFTQKGEVDIVSPFSTQVRESLTKYVDALAEAQAELDALVLTYQLPRNPIFAYGTESRTRYVALSSLDPVDMIEKPTLQQSDQPNSVFTDYMAWRLKESNVFLGQFLGRIRTKLPTTSLALRADPEWASRNLFEKGSKLNDWVFQAVEHPNVGLLIDCDPADPREGMRVGTFLNSIRILSVKPSIWIDTAGTEEQVQPVANRFTHLGLPLHVLLRR
jgi:hypothetical protein